MLYVFSVNYFDIFLLFNETKRNDTMGIHFIEKLKTLNTSISSQNKKHQEKAAFNNNNFCDLV